MATSEAGVLPGRRQTGKGQDRKPLLGVVRTLASRIAAAADGGRHVLLAEAERCLAELGGGRGARILVDSAGSWRHWRRLDTPDPAYAEPLPAAIPAAIAARAELQVHGGQLILPIRPGSIVALLDQDSPGPNLTDAFALLANAIDLALAICDRWESATRSAGELEVMRTVATRILQSSDLHELLLLVSYETIQLLSSDICGVMMREGDELAMQACVGNFSAETARLRMHSGVGVAGQVLATGQPCTVANYVQSEIITRDFVPLAEGEKVRSALAVPILSHNAIIGVLEVWRRRPSHYTDEDIRLLSALAGLGSLAISNACLLSARTKAAEELAAANAALAERYRTIERSAHFQEEIIRLMLGESPLASLASRTADHTEGTILVLDRDFSVELAVPALVAAESGIVDEIKLLLKRTSRLTNQAVVHPLSTGHVCLQPVLAGTEMLGWIVWLGDRPPPEATRLALGSVALVTALHLLERRRIARERGETLQAVLWDLLEGSEAVRAVALDRARELQVTLKGPFNVLVALLEIKGAASVPGDTEGRLQEQALERVLQSELGRSAYLAGVRGKELRIIQRARQDDELSTAARCLANKLRRESPALVPVIGISGICQDVHGLPAAFREAMVALEVARHRKDMRIARYSEAGVLGLLINLRNKADMSRVCGEILGALMSEPEPSRGVLINTLSAFFESDCSQVATAARLGVHQKTVAYRLAKLGRLTGLDLARHQDRLLADLATKMIALMNAE